MSLHEGRGWWRADLGYCSNVHAGESLAALTDNLSHYAAAVRQRRRLDVMAMTPWISAKATREWHGDDAARGVFLDRLRQCGLSVVSINGFPYGDFHRHRVKERVYRPDWTTPSRLNYTLALAEILSECLGECADRGWISTLPLGQRDGWTAEHHLQAARQLCRLVQGLARIHDQHGHDIMVCLEMEPGCALETTTDAIAFLTGTIEAAAREQDVPLEWLRRHLGICFDICHQAVMFETVTESLAAFERAGIAVGKIQVSNAIHVERPQDADCREGLARYDEPRYLHQTTTLDTQGRQLRVMDLDMALSSPAFPRERPWRTHFHVPICRTILPEPGLETCQDEILSTLDHLSVSGQHPHLEVETYTWPLLPAISRPSDNERLIAGLVAELDWLEQALTRRDLIVEET